MKTEIRTLETVAAKGRLLGLDMVYHCASGHLGGSFSAMDILTVLYFEVMNVDPKNPADPDRDRFVLSKGHCTPALYPILAQKGYFPEEDLALFRSVEGHLSGHAEMNHVKGVDMSTGSLGQGISIAGGMALSHKLAGRANRVFCIVGDGELNEGQCWEAFQFIAHHRLNNLTVFVDWNKLQLDGRLDEIIRAFNLEDKFRAFGFDVVTVKGDDIPGLLAAVQPVPPVDARPRVVILDSVKGQGVPYLENLSNNHHLRLTAEMKETLNETIRQLEAEHD